MKNLLMGIKKYVIDL